MGTMAVATLAACVSPPTLQSLQSMAGLLVNVREVTLSGLILREDFYTEANLKRVCGGSAVKLSRIAMDESVLIGADIGGFPPWPGMRPAANANLQLRVSRYKGYLSDGRPVGIVVIRNDEASDLKFEAIEQGVRQELGQGRPATTAVSTRADSTASAGHASHGLRDCQFPTRRCRPGSQGRSPIRARRNLCHSRSLGRQVVRKSFPCSAGALSRLRAIVTCCYRVGR